MEIKSLEVKGLKVNSLLEKVLKGEIVLPDFQRSFIWGPEDIRELLVSVLGNYFIGSMLVMVSLKDEAPFALRLIEGVKEINPEAEIQSLVSILLDGQQRTTALFYAMYEVPLPLKGRKNPYKFYINLEEVIKEEPNWDDAVLAVSVADKKRLREIEDNKMIIPIRAFRDIKELMEELRNKKHIEDWNLVTRIIELANSFLNYEIHMVVLPRGTDIHRIVEAFERINRTGEPLSIFDLLTARLYKYGIKVRDLIEETKDKYSFAGAVQPDTILKVIALLRGKEPKRRNLLELEPVQFEEHWNLACEYLQKAYERITDIKNGYGVLDFKKWMPYSTMIVPLAALLYFVDTNKEIKNAKTYHKIDVWYWISVFSKRYDEGVDTKILSDFKSVREWIEDDKKIPNFVLGFKPEDIDLDVDNQSSSVYRGVINLITLRGALDFKTGQPPQFEKGKVQDDHIFPKSIYKENGVANRTIISTNQSKINKRPSEYFGERIKELGEAKVKKILASHLIPPEALDCLLGDDLEKFMELRKSEIIKEIRRRTELRDNN